MQTVLPVYHAVVKSDGAAAPVVTAAHITVAWFVPAKVTRTVSDVVVDETDSGPVEIWLAVLNLTQPP